MSTFNVSDLFPRNIPYAEPDLSGFVYVAAMLAPSGPVYKIGRSRDVSARISQLDWMLPYRTITIFVMWAKDVVGQEAYLHRYFVEYGLRGEWFALPESALEELHELAEIMRSDTPESELKHLCAMPLEAWRMHQEMDSAKRSGDVARIAEVHERLMRLIRAVPEP